MKRRAKGNANCLILRLHNSRKELQVALQGSIAAHFATQQILCTRPILSSLFFPKNRKTTLKNIALQGRKLLIVVSAFRFFSPMTYMGEVFPDKSNLSHEKKPVDEGLVFKNTRRLPFFIKMWTVYLVVNIFFLLIFKI